ncbi:formyltetrahydrofolate deformylase [Pelagibaculum spongiae]|uniref:Formyltetrahydrofolate deformylase n=1 Tax=Pelagibaculum spongiae TaxID=2080658 RepID=A0A2V1H3M8_9GAMM|nr:formyltetrahydrofolate deformylase [Pelagibaculum spongiae]PVZ70619.1 formyltetrahydrofolate deformylase [Pelagibaculum spongiae]
MKPVYRLTVSCPDRVGIVAKVSEFIACHGGWIIEANHHSDTESGWFFMRHEIITDSITIGLDQFKALFAPIASRFEMEWQITASEQKPKVVLMVSKEAHCLNDILFRWKSGEMNCDIVAVISNHDDLRGMCEWMEIPYHHVPVDKQNKAPHFAAVEQLIEQYQADTIILARYMQILPEAVCTRYPGQIINIHHSFLPSFAGAKPYHQASVRGVKLIGATCHYVTTDLDAGPIIEQDVLRIDHGDTTEDMQRMGRDVEKMVLSRGLRYHLEDRVLLHGNKTVVFD